MSIDPNQLPQQGSEAEELTKLFGDYSEFVPAAHDNKEASEISTDEVPPMGPTVIPPVENRDSKLIVSPTIDTKTKPQPLQETPKPEAETKKSHKNRNIGIAGGVAAILAVGAGVALTAGGGNEAPSTEPAQTTVAPNPGTNVELGAPVTVDVEPTTPATEAPVQETVPTEVTESPNTVVDEEPQPTTPEQINDGTYGNIELETLDPGENPITVTRVNGDQVQIPRLPELSQDNPNEFARVALAQIAAYMTTESPEILESFTTDPTVRQELIDWYQVGMPAIFNHERATGNAQLVMFDNPSNPAEFQITSSSGDRQVLTMTSGEIFVDAYEAGNLTFIPEDANEWQNSYARQNGYLTNSITTFELVVGKTPSGESTILDWGRVAGPNGRS